MIDVVFFSVAGNQDLPEITELFQRWYDSPLVPKKYKEPLKYTLDIVHEAGYYPAKDYYDTFFSDSGQYYASVAELLHYAKIADDFFERMDLQEKVTQSMNSSRTSSELKAQLSELLDQNNIPTAAADYGPKLYSAICEQPHTEGIKSGITPIDQLTNGFLPSTVATIAAFTGHGKTTAWLSILAKAALAGKKCVYLSLELAPELIWMMLEARYMYEVHNLNITTTDLIQRKLTKEMLAKVKSFEPEYQEKFAKNIIVTDSSEITKETRKSSTAWINLFRKWESVLGDLDLVVHDHVGQYERLFPEEGNTIIKLITDATVRYRSRLGTKVVTGWACQANRQGLSRADKRNGIYDLAAISDLNEVERSSTYVVFLYTPDDRKLAQETLVTMAKHRLGSVLPEPTPVAFLPAVCIVGSNVEQISYDGDLGALGGDFGDFSSGDFGDEF